MAISFYMITLANIKKLFLGKLGGNSQCISKAILQCFFSKEPRFSQLKALLI